MDMPQNVAKCLGLWFNGGWVCHENETNFGLNCQTSVCGLVSKLKYDF